VRSGKIRIFERRELTIDVLLASACLPQLFRAVEIDGDPYWDGGYMGNPAIFPLIYGCVSPDVAIVQINPLAREGVPKTSTEILNRLTEISSPHLCARCGRSSSSTGSWRKSRSRIVPHPGLRQFTFI
jgi:NTE family protein